MKFGKLTQFTFLTFRPLKIYDGDSRHFDKTNKKIASLTHPHHHILSILPDETRNII